MSMREIKFRAWRRDIKQMYSDIQFADFQGETIVHQQSLNEGIKIAQGAFFDIMQYTGLKDKNGDADIYECDIIDSNGNKKGNTYEMDAEETDFVIQDFGGKDWCSTYKEAMARGCKHA